jgi:hypothetical protein
VSKHLSWPTYCITSYLIHKFVSFELQSRLGSAALLFHYETKQETKTQKTCRPLKKKKKEKFSTEWPPTEFFNEIPCLPTTRTEILFFRNLIHGMNVGTYLFGFVCEAMNEVSDESSSLRVKLERSACPQCNLQGAGSRSCDVENVTETGRLSIRRKYIKDTRTKRKWV